MSKCRAKLPRSLLRTAAGVASRVVSFVLEDEVLVCWQRKVFLLVVLSFSLFSCSVFVFDLELLMGSLFRHTKKYPGGVGFADPFSSSAKKVRFDEGVRFPLPTGESWNNHLERFHTARSNDNGRLGQPA